MDAAGELAQLVDGEPELLADAAEMGGAVVVEPVLEHFEFEADGQQAVLGAVVEVALEAAAGLVGGGDDPGAARLELALALEPVGDVANVAGVHGRARNVDAGDRQLDRDLAAVGVQRGDLDTLAEQRAVPAGEPFAVALAQVRRDEHRAELAADDRLRVVAEEVADGGVDLDDPARRCRS